MTKLLLILKLQLKLYSYKKRTFLFKLQVKTDQINLIVTSQQKVEM